MVSGNFLGTVRNTIRISLLDILEYIRILPTYYERFAIAEAIGVLIANELTGGGLEYHDEYERIVARVPVTLARQVENVTEALIVMEKGQIRRGMFRAVIRILGETKLEST